MSEQTPSASDEPYSLAFVSEEDFASVDVEGPIRGSSSVVWTELCQSFGQAERTAKIGKDSRAERVYALIGAICSLRLEMRALQERSVDEMGSFEIPLDLGEMRSGVIDIFEKITLPMALRQIALLGRSYPIEDLKKQALASLAESPLMARLEGVHYDGEGKITAETSGAPTKGEPDDDWFKRTIAQNFRIQRHVFVGGSFDAARGS
jgi:hypothetical protein